MIFGDFLHLGIYIHCSSLYIPFVTDWLQGVAKLPAATTSGLLQINEFHPICWLGFWSERRRNLRSFPCVHINGSTPNSGWFVNDVLCCFSQQSNMFKFMYHSSILIGAASSFNKHISGLQKQVFIILHRWCIIDWFPLGSGDLIRFSLMYLLGSMLVASLSCLTPLP